MNATSGGYIPINASEMRSRLFEILSRVYLKKEKFVVKKSWIDVAKISGPEDDVSNILRFAGIWKDLNSKKLKDEIYSSRKDQGTRKQP